jgi:hypothetical protein
MKYIITENKINNAIEKYIKEMFPMVNDVYFTKVNKTLASSEGTPTVEETVINIIIENSKNKLNYHELNELGRIIVKSVDGFFNLKYDEYGSNWDFAIMQLAVVNINTGLMNLKKR